MSGERAQELRERLAELDASLSVSQEWLNGAGSGEAYFLKTLSVVAELTMQTAKTVRTLLWLEATRA